jgi:hypothetical protein
MGFSGQVHVSAAVHDGGKSIPLSTDENFTVKNTVTWYVCVTLDGGLDWVLDLLTTYAHYRQLQRHS